MRAVQIKKYGGSEVLEINNNASKPNPLTNQVLVEVHTTSINPFDVKLRQGLYKESIPLQFPVTLGGDFAGIVTKVALAITEFKVGDEVFGQANVVGGGTGSLAEFVATPIKSTALKPKTANFEQSAVLPLVGTSAIQAIEEHIKLKPGQKILIHGGAGGIGHIATQLAKTIGAYVTTTVSTNDLEFVKHLGADEIIDYRNQDFSELSDFDAVFDTVGGETTDKSFTVLKRNGIIVSMLGKPNEDLAKKYGVTAIGQITKTNQDHLRRLSELVDQGKIRVNIDKIFSLEKIKEAFIYQEQIHPQGKIVIKIKD